MDKSNRSFCCRALDDEVRTKRRQKVKDITGAIDRPHPDRFPPMLFNPFMRPRYFTAQTGEPIHEFRRRAIYLDFAADGIGAATLFELQVPFAIEQPSKIAELVPFFGKIERLLPNPIRSPDNIAVAFQGSPNGTLAYAKPLRDRGDGLTPFVGLYKLIRQALSKSFHGLIITLAPSLVYQSGGRLLDGRTWDEMPQGAE